MISIGEYMYLRTTVYGQEPKTFLWFSFYHTVLLFRVVPDNMFSISMQLFMNIGDEGLGREYFITV